MLGGRQSQGALVRNLMKSQTRRAARLSLEEELSLAVRVRDHGDLGAAHKLVTANLAFVVAVAREYRGYGVDLNDLIQEGNIGLMEAVRRFDPARGSRFLTYAVYWIRDRIQKYLLRSMKIFRISGSSAQHKLFFKYRSTKGRLMALGISNRTEVNALIAEKLKVSLRDVEAFEERMAQRVLSIDAPCDEKGNTFSHRIPTTEPDQEHRLGQLEEAAERQGLIRMALAALEPREREIIEKRYLVSEPFDLVSLGRELGVSMQRVSQIEHRSLEKLRRFVRRAA
jgi:RNA polymerase sigma-32 factor